MRTGSIGNRDAESLIKTLVEPKRTILSSLRMELLSLGYAEEAGYDAINIESYVMYSISGVSRFFLKHKWELLVTLVFQDSKELSIAVNSFADLGKKESMVNPEDGTISYKLSPKEDRQLIGQLASYFKKQVF